MADFRGRGRRTDKVWQTNGAGPQRTVITTESSVAYLTSLAFTEAGTILRIRADFLVAFNAATAASDACVLAFGIGLVSTDAFLASAFPDPVAEPEYPWMWWKSILMQSTFAIDGTGTDHSGQLQHRVEVDTKAMRKFKPRQSLAFIVEYVDLNGLPPVVIVAGNARVLVGT